MRSHTSTNTSSLLAGLALSIFFLSLQSTFLQHQIRWHVDHAIAETQASQQRLFSRQQQQWEALWDKRHQRQLLQQQAISDKLLEQVQASLEKMQALQQHNKDNSEVQTALTELQDSIEETTERLLNKKIPGETQTAKASPTTSARSSSSLLHQVAPAFFPIDFVTGKIMFPPTVTTILIDVGAKEPAYFLDMVTRMRDPTVGLIMFDPLYDGYVPIARRALDYTMQHSDPLADYIASPDTTKRVFAIQAAIGPTEGQVEFQLSESAYCGTIKQGKVFEDTATGCKKGIGSVRAQVFTLHDVLALIPQNNTTTIHIKIDAEGVDNDILFASAKAFSARVETVVVEKNTDPRDKAGFLCQHAGLCNQASSCCNTIFWRHDKSALPSFLRDKTMRFQNSTVEFQELFQLVQ
ncbi:expressed unknown protein [Seminavis robusta]|uniref:Methyltransferase FkbM domain-containing protein n=1 Tax=Seminavis robusta TaxID=568900 RepID=A0A9N8EHD4_9STRA|nr:expressed unknown protein [Seminavis robusta]|eukprot:Sro1193_g251150.1 n/a (409) ;mRNA; r:6545-7771